MSQVRTQMLFLDQIRLDERVQSRAKLDEPTIVRYVESLTEGAEPPPLIVYDDGQDLWLADGNHRYHAMSRAGRDQALCEIRKGTIMDAKVCAAGSNAFHGLPRSTADKRRSVLMLLEEQQFAKLSDRELARMTNTSHPFIATVRRDLSGSDTRCDEDHRPRVVTRGGTTFLQNTANIGHKCEPQPPEPQDDQEPAAEDPGDPLPDDAPLASIQTMVQRVRQQVQDLCAKPLGAFLHHQAIDADLKNVWNQIKYARPHAACPYCKGQQPNVQSCRACKKLGWVPQQIFKLAPAEMRA